MPRWLSCAVLVVFAGVAPASAGQPPGPQRIAVVVGANAAAPGRPALRYAHDDARAVARVLRSLGRFAAHDVHLLLDPSPATLLAVLDRQLSRLSGAGSMLFLYYSGHADGQRLYPAGTALAVNELRRRLEDPRAELRIGVIDTCHGGIWTGSKGLRATEVFAVQPELWPASHGSALIAASSGFEAAHESERLRGSFFTHHWNNALRGAGDTDRDGRVSLNEAFDYARLMTIRDTAVQVATPQHPSFHFHLRGRKDVVLTQLGATSSVLQLSQRSGPLQLIHLDSGTIQLEVPPGPRQLRVAVPPGRYLVRKQSGTALAVGEVQVAPGQVTAISESNLRLLGDTRLLAKGRPDQPDPLRNRTLRWELMLGASLARPSYRRTTSDTSRSVPGYTWRSATVEIGGGASLLLRTGKHLATRIGAGYARIEDGGGGGGNGGYLALAQSLSWPLVMLRERIPGLSPAAIEPYIEAHVTGLAELQRRDVPLQLLGGLSAGLRLYLLYAQIGHSWIFLPTRYQRSWSTETQTFSAPRGGLSGEVGLRLVKNFD